MGGTELEHFNAMDGMLREYKGYVDTTKPIYRPRRRVARQNSYVSEAMAWDNGRYVYDREVIDPGFGISPNRNSNLDADDGYESSDLESDDEIHPDEARERPDAAPTEEARSH